MAKEPEPNLNQKGILWLTLPSQKSPVKALYQKPKHLHVTLMFNVTYEDAMKHIKFEPIIVKATENCYNDDIQALKVTLPSPFKGLCQNKIPHMTISHKNGVAPFKSNEMLEGYNKTEKINETMTLYAEFFAFK